MFQIKRIYDPPSDDDGYRVLVDRIWPRGVSKDKAQIDAWMKDVTPSPDLRIWFGHDPARWHEFKALYLAELKDPTRRACLNDLRARASRGALTLLYAARDDDHNHAVVLLGVLQEAKSDQE